VQSVVSKELLSSGSTGTDQKVRCQTYGYVMIIEASGSDEKVPPLYRHYIGPPAGLSRSSAKTQEETSHATYDY
jgi:hypothetical protein